MKVLLIALAGILICLLGCASKSTFSPKISHLQENEYPNTITLSTTLPCDEKHYEQVGKLLRLGYYPTTRYEIAETWRNPFELRAFITFSKHWPIIQRNNSKILYCDKCYWISSCNERFTGFVERRNGKLVITRDDSCENCRIRKELMILTYRH